MATTESILLEDQATGANNNTWGDVADANFAIIDKAIGIFVGIATTGGTTTLSDDQNARPLLDFTGTLASNATIVVATRKKWWLVRNRTSGAFTLTVKTAAGTGIAVTQGRGAILYCDGVNVLQVDNLEAAASAASESAAGVVELATSTEVLSGTDNTRAVHPDGLAALWEKGSDVASAATLSLGEGGFFHITGTTTITNVDFATPKDGRRAIVEFDGILTLTHHTTTLKLPTGANITTAAGDTACFVQDNSDNVKCAWYQRASGEALTAASSTRLVGEMVDYGGTAAPSLWLLCFGQAVSRTTYSALFAVISTTYGVGDGSTTFNIPDRRGRVSAGQDDMGGTSANRLTGLSGGVDGDVLGASGGAETHVITNAHLPSGVPTSVSYVADVEAVSGSFDDVVRNTGQSEGSNTAHNNVQPTLINNVIIYAGV